MTEETQPTSIDNEPAGVGDNIPPEPIDEEFDALQTRTDDLVVAANAWLNDVPAILNDEQAGRCSDFTTQITKHTAAVEKERKEKKDPHKLAGEAVDKRFNPLKQQMKIVKDLLRPIMTAWLQKKEDERQERERAAEAEAERLRKEAEDAVKKAEEAKGDVVGNTVAAEQAQGRAEEAQTQAKTVARSTVAIKSDYAEKRRGLRTTKRAEIRDFDRALRHYRDHPEVAALIVKLASADARAGKKRIPGCKVIEERKAA